MGEHVCNSYHRCGKEYCSTHRVHGEILDEIIAGGGISDTHLRMLVDQIIVDEADGKLSIEICLKAAFRRHYDVYDEFMELIETGGDVSFDITPYLQNRAAIEA